MTGTKTFINKVNGRLHSILFNSEEVLQQWWDSIRASILSTTSVEFRLLGLNFHSKWVASWIKAF
jgi:hypothetical protein